MFLWSDVLIYAANCRMFNDETLSKRDADQLVQISHN